MFSGSRGRREVRGDRQFRVGPTDSLQSHADSSQPIGVSCGICHNDTFTGIRYRCLTCPQLHLCAACYNDHRSSSEHLTSHPVQPILTESDFEMYYGLEAMKGDKQNQSYTCPYCGVMGFSSTLLRDHISAEHADSIAPVVCPFCAVFEGGNASTYEGLLPHIASSHPDISSDRNAAHDNRIALFRAHHAHHHGVWMSLQTQSRRADHDHRNREELLTHLSSMRRQLIADELLSLELQFTDTNHRLANLAYGDDELQMLLDLASMPSASTEQTHSVAVITNASSAAVTEPEKPEDAEICENFLLKSLDDVESEEEKEIREVELADRSVFVQELLAHAFIVPIDSENVSEQNFYTHFPTASLPEEALTSLISTPSCIQSGQSICSKSSSSVVKLLDSTTIGSLTDGVGQKPVSASSDRLE